MFPITNGRLFIFVNTLGIMSLNDQVPTIVNLSVPRSNILNFNVFWHMKTQKLFGAFTIAAILEHKLLI